MRKFCPLRFYWCPGAVPAARIWLGPLYFSLYFQFSSDASEQWRTLFSCGSSLQSSSELGLSHPSATTAVPSLWRTVEVLSGKTQASSPLLTVLPVSCGAIILSSCELLARMGPAWLPGVAGIPSTPSLSPRASLDFLLVSRSVRFMNVHIPKSETFCFSLGERWRKSVLRFNGWTCWMSKEIQVTEDHSWC